MKGHVLLVEDDEAFAYAVANRLRRDGLEVRTAASLREAKAHLARGAPALAVVDFQLPDGTGLDFVRSLAADEPIATLMLTAFGSIEGAVEAMKAGCSDYVTKDSNLDEIAARVRKVLDVADLRQRVERYESAFGRTSADYGVDGTSAAMSALREEIGAAAAARDTTVLIHGESGTGKQLVARAIHAASERRDRPHIEVDCTTLTANLFESELFGHERGAFTGADQKKLGLVEAADGGTLFLDEIGEVEPTSQGKLLRLLQERRFRRVGSVKDREVDVRIIAATNRVLAEEVTRGRFRADLLYRLRVLVIQVPPLRERDADAVLLAKKFVQELGKKLGKSGIQLSDEALVRIRGYGFPGNVRELRACIEQAMVRVRGAEIDAAGLFLPDAVPTGRRPTGRRAGRPATSVSADQAARLRAVMEKHFGNQSRAADELGISRFVLKRRLQALRSGEGGDG